MAASMTTSPMMLDEHKDLFKSEQAFEQFVERMNSSLADAPMLAVFSNKKLLFTVVSPDATKDVLYERILRQLSDDPSILDDIQHRIENEEIVE